MPDHAGHVCLVETGPPAARLPLPERAELIGRLVAAGLRDIHLGDASRPDVVTALARAPHRHDLRYPLRVEDAGALEAALGAGLEEIELTVPASGHLCRATHGLSHEAWLAHLEPVAALAAEHGVRLRGLVRAAVVCPLQGALTPAAAATRCDELADLGCYEVSLAEDTGEATPAAVRAVWDACAAGIGPDRLAVRLRAGPHAAPSLQALLGRGLQTVDTALGSLDGQPAGTVATEDVVDLLRGLDVATWIDPELLVETAWWLGGRLGRAPAGRTSRHHHARQQPARTP
jgi:hydroxymethylglutaryl-CoA lyase